jgi:hypothetical protein
MGEICLMPCTIAMQQYLNPSQQREHAPMETETTAYVPIYWRGYHVADMTAHVRANYDQAFGKRFGSMSADAWIENASGKRHYLNDEDTDALMRQIHDLCPDAWREIEQRSGKYGDEDEDYYESRYAEDFMPALECPR